MKCMTNVKKLQKIKVLIYIIINKEKVKNHEAQEKLQEKDILTEAVRNFEEEQAKIKEEEFLRNKNH